MKGGMSTLSFLAMIWACDGGQVDIHDTGDTGKLPVDSEDSGETAETGETGDTGANHGTGYLSRSGVGTATLDTLDGTEEWALLDEDDVDLCRLSSVATSTGTRSDCAQCAWAQDLVLSGTVEVSAGTCAALGVDPADFDGLTRSYGYVPDYYGHAQVIMEDAGGGWDAQGYATWDEATGAFAWYIDDGEISY